MRPIWIVDDDQSIRFVLEKALLKASLPTRSFTNPHEVIAALDADDGEVPSVVISDIRMPGTTGLALLQTLKQRMPKLPIIIMTAYSDLDSAVSAFQGGAFEYLPKPFDLTKAVELIQRALSESERHSGSTESLDSATEMLGQAPVMQDVFRAIGRLSSSHVTVLITGESGSGKELVARALHQHSPRADGAFVAINTAAIPKDLLESELFGHERGAFTGAQTMRRGRFEQADGGTLFLDEIGDMPFDLQTRLLRVLSDGHFYRVGGHQAIKANVRVIAATHQDLEKRVREGLFREDLFHRLNVIRIRLPALRERQEDIPLLTRHFLARSAQQLGVEPKRLSDPALQHLLRFGFPGNVRQLENICHWLTVMAPMQQIDVKDLPPEVLQPSPAAQDVASLNASSPVLAVPAAAVAPALQAGVVLDGLHGGGEGIHTAPMAGSTPWPGGAEIAAGTPASTLSDGSELSDDAAWQTDLRTHALALLRTGRTDVWDTLTQRFERTLIEAALSTTRGRRIEASLKLGIGRNTLTRKIQELGMDAQV